MRGLGSKPLLVLLIAQTAQSHTKQISSNLPPVGHKVLNHPSQQFHIPSTSTYLLVMFFQCVFASAQTLLSFFFKFKCPKHICSLLQSLTQYSICICFLNMFLYLMVTSSSSKCLSLRSHINSLFILVWYLIVRFTF